MARVRLGLDELNSEQLVTKANATKTAMTGNANFTTPLPTLASFGTDITAISNALAAVEAAKAALETALANRDTFDAALRLSYTKLGDYVQSVSGGDTAKIESAAISTRAQPVPITMTQVLDLVLSEGDDSGTLDIVWKPVKGARSYEIQINTVNPNNASDWTFKQSSTNSRDQLEGLTSGVKVWARVRAIGGSNDKGPWSDPAVKTVP